MLTMEKAVPVWSTSQKHYLNPWLDKGLEDAVPQTKEWHVLCSSAHVWRIQAVRRALEQAVEGINHGVLCTVTWCGAGVCSDSCAHCALGLHWGQKCSRSQCSESTMLKTNPRLLDGIRIFFRDTQIFQGVKEVCSKGSLTYGKVIF